MADFSRDWLDAQLQRQLAPVQAPDSLWTRVQAERRERRNRPRAVWMLWPAVATVLLLASVDLFWQVGKAAEAGSRIESDNPATLRAWVKAKANIDVDLVCGGAAKIRFSGARLMHVREEMVAAISYELQGKPGLLLVSKKGPAPLTMDLDVSCRRCHVDGHGQI